MNTNIIIIIIIIINSLFFFDKFTKYIVLYVFSFDLA